MSCFPCVALQINCRKQPVFLVRVTYKCFCSLNKQTNLVFYIDLEYHLDLHADVSEAFLKISLILTLTFFVVLTWKVNIITLLPLQVIAFGRHIVLTITVLFCHIQIFYLWIQTFIYLIQLFDKVRLKRSIRNSAANVYAQFVSFLQHFVCSLARVLLRNTCCYLKKTAYKSLNN